MISILKRKINVVDSLTSTSAVDALSANQGKVLNDQIKAQIICRTFTFTDVPVTTLSGSGAYFLAGNSLNIEVSGYIPISATVVDWSGWAANALPYIRNDNYSLSFVSDISQTLSEVKVRVVYMQA